MRIARFLFVLVFSAAAVARAADTGPTGNVDSALEEARTAIAKQDWGRAVSVLERALRQDARNAQYHNLLGYALRKGPQPDMPRVFFHYREALRLDPKHLGAHEYIAEAYLMTGEPARAREHLAMLEKLCARCEETEDLRRSIAAYEAKGSGTAPQKRPEERRAEPRY